MTRLDKAGLAIGSLVMVGILLILMSGCTNDVRVQFENCDEAREVGAPLPLTAADPGWNARLDTDHDGLACEA